MCASSWSGSGSGASALADAPMRITPTVSRNLRIYLIVRPQWLALQGCFKLDAFAGVQVRKADMSDARRRQQTGQHAGAVPTPNSPPRTVSTLIARRDEVTRASAILAAARPSVCGPGGQRRARRLSRRLSWTCVRTRSREHPPIDASPHGTRNPDGGVPRTASVTSDGEQRASSATMARTAPASASGAERSGRLRSNPASRSCRED